MPPWTQTYRSPSFAMLLVALAGSVHSQPWTWPGCADVTDAQFRYTYLVRRGQAPDPSLAEPVKMDFDMDASGNVDIYYVQRGGTAANGVVKRFNGAANTVTTLATLPTFRGPMLSGGNVEEGLTGIALDPDFKTNRYVYLHWSPAAASVFRLSRFTLSGTSLGSEKILLDIPAQRNVCCHTGGAMAFDAYGDLWIGMGNNANGFANPMSIDENVKYNSDEWGASSTHGLRGSILRIHPDNSARGYSIPAGNFGDYFAGQTGNAAYRDTSRVYAEIYIKGVRNPYSLQLDPVRRWVMFGDVGPDRGGADEEWNLFKNPVFAGWPYFTGNNAAFAGNKSVSAPTNTSKWNAELNGLTTLPPAQPAIVAYNQSAAMTGPLYRYDGDLQSAVKLPPHFNRKWFVADYNNNQIRLLTLNEAGTAVTANQRIFANGTFSGIVDFKTGPNGALYVLNYGNAFFSSTNSTGIQRIDYMGTCRPAEPKLEKPVTPILDPGARFTARPEGWLVHLGSGRPVRVPEGRVGFEVYDLMGRKIWQVGSLKPGSEFHLPPDLPRGALKYRWVAAVP